MYRYVVRREDFNRMLNAPKDLKIKLMFRILHDTGIRTGELVSLRVEDIDLDNRTMTITDSKKKESFTLPLTHKTCELLAEYIEDLGSYWLFPSPYRENRHLCIDWVGQLVKRQACKLNLPHWQDWTPRFFRRRFARNWIDKKGSLTGLQEILRHEQISSTATYIDGIRFDDEIRKEFDEIMEDYA